VVAKNNIQGGFKFVLVGLISCLVIAIIILSWVPPVSKDALVHHLAVPKLYLKHGGIYEIPALLFSYYPMNLDLLYILPLYFGNDIIPKFIHFAFALITAGIIFGYLKKRIDTLYAMIGTIFFLSIPIIVKLSISVYVDLGLICFSMAALMYFLKWIENHFKLKYLIVAAVWCGLALGTKYNGLILLFLLTLFVPFIYSRRVSGHISGNTSHQVKALGYGAVFMLVALLVFSPWMIKNYIWTRNPVYPLYNQWFNPAKVVPKPDSATQSTSGAPAGSEVSKKPLGHFAIRNIQYGESWWRIGLIPVRIFFEGQDGSPQYFDGRLNPFLFFLPVFAFIGLGKSLAILRTEKKIFLAFALLYLLFVFFRMDMRIRWIAPIIPPLVILSVLGLHDIRTAIADRFPSKGAIVGGSVTFAIVAVVLSMNTGYIIDQFRHVDPVSYITGKIGRDEYIERFRHEYPAIRFANHKIPEDAKVFALFLGNRNYYSDREMVFDENHFREIVWRATSPKEVLIKLKKRGITHLLIRYDLFNEWFDTNFKDKEKETLGEFFKTHSIRIYYKNGYGLFRLENTGVSN
jgi:4-amino-4-deoxy-L-arabinose transferase-like glycosyltransferase